MAARMMLMLTACIAATLMAGCATAKKDTTGFAVQEELTLAMPYAEAWQHVKHTLTAQEFTLYTRDKRGVFVAYTGGKRLLGFNRPRTQYTLDLEPTTSVETKVSISVVKQKYGTSLTTYPDWHDRKTEPDDTLANLVAALKGEIAPEAVEAAAAEAEEMAPEAAPATDAATAEEAAPETPAEQGDVVEATEL